MLKACNITSNNKLTDQYEIELTFKDNIKLVYRAIYDLPFTPHNIDQEELEQVGKIALWKAIISYKQNEKYSLSTHAYRIITGDLIDYLRKTRTKKRNDNNTIEYDTLETTAIEIDKELFSDLIVDEIKRIAGEEDANIFLDKYLYGLPVYDLVIKYNSTTKKIRKRLEKTKFLLQLQLLDWKVN
jgi:RNA polymerase sigma factor (sigma-70 family)